MNIDKTNFHLNTRGRFVRCNKPQGTPDYISMNRNGQVSSTYYYTDNGVVRYSNHWGGVASCLWLIDDMKIANGIDDCKLYKEEISAFITFDELSENVEKWQISVNKMMSRKIEQVKIQKCEGFSGLDKNTTEMISIINDFRNESDF